MTPSIMLETNNEYILDRIKEMLDFDDINWERVLIYKDIDPDLFRVYKVNITENKLWTTISRYQKLDEDFIKEFIGYLSVEALVDNHKISDDIREKYIIPYKTDVAFHYMWRHNLTLNNIKIMTWVDGIHLNGHNSLNQLNNIVNRIKNKFNE